MEHINKLTNLITKQENKIKELTGQYKHYEAKCFELVEENNMLKEQLKKIHIESKIKNIVKLLI